MRSSCETRFDRPHDLSKNRFGHESLCVLEYALFQQRNDARNGFDFEALPFVREEFESLWPLPARLRPKKPWLRAENLDHRPGLRGCGASGVEGQGVWMHS